MDTVCYYPNIPYYFLHFSDECLEEYYGVI